MTPLVFVAVAVAGGLGAASRYLVDIAVARVVGARFPWGILAVNVSGSLLIGLVAGVAASFAGEAGTAVSWIAGTGFLGGYTTFSGVAVTSVLLAEERRPVAGVLNSLGTFVLAVAAAWTGFLLIALA